MTNKLSKRAKAKKAFEIHQQLIQLGHSVQRAFILIGKYLYQIQKDNLFKYLGKGGYDTFNSYLASPELEISRRQAFYLMKIYKIYCKKFGVPIKQMEGAKLSSLKETLPVVSEENYEDWLEKSKVLSLSDIRIEIKKESTGIDPTKCRHKWIKKIYWECEKCGERQWGPMKPNE